MRIAIARLLSNIRDEWAVIGPIRDGIIVIIIIADITDLITIGVKLPSIRDYNAIVVLILYAITIWIQVHRRDSRMTTTGVGGRTSWQTDQRRQGPIVTEGPDRRIPTSIGSWMTTSIARSTRTTQLANSAVLAILNSRAPGALRPIRPANANARLTKTKPDQATIE